MSQWDVEDMGSVRWIEDLTVIDAAVPTVPTRRESWHGATVR